jgi:hypothetical protein
VRDDSVCNLSSTGEARRDKSALLSETIGRWNANSVLHKYGLSVRLNRGGLLWSQISGVDGTGSIRMRELGVQIGNFGLGRNGRFQ